MAQKKRMGGLLDSWINGERAVADRRPSAATEEDGGWRWVVAPGELGGQFLPAQFVRRMAGSLPVIGRFYLFPMSKNRGSGAKPMLARSRDRQNFLPLLGTISLDFCEIIGVFADFN